MVSLPGVPGIADCIGYSPFYLVNLAFGFKFLVAGDAPSKLLNLAGCRAVLKTDLPHFRCRVKLRLKHPKAALALSEARNLPAHTFAA